MARFKRTTIYLVIAALLIGTSTAAVAESLSQEQDNTEIESIMRWQGTPAEGMNEHWAKRLFQWGIAQNVINGYPNQSLKPDQVVTEAEFLKMLYRAMGMALLNASTAYDPSESWTDGPYRMAGYYNHPTVGDNNYSMRLQPITKLRAAELISASQGVHYTGDDAITYLIGHGLANSEASSSEQFDGDSTFSRAEALQWIRQFALHGKLKMHKRPATPTDRSLLPALSNTPIALISDFSTEPVTHEDFNLFGSDDFPGVRFGDMKRTVDERFGDSEEKDIFNFDTYPLISAHFNTNGRLDAWSINSFTSDKSSKTPSLRTKKGIVLGESTLLDIINQYGSAGVTSRGIIEFYYEKVDDSTYHDISIYDPIQNIEKVYTIVFIVDDETKVVFDVMASSFKTVLEDF
ncbi:S-layer homology domain-containing protein [Paenibacillus sp. FA6]|uniref:S-layer homology domain-containing protein n=1 Tax=Paenibacillus sp. FA6 TaxID=3413029 RepID=UPI003F65C335